MIFYVFMVRAIDQWAAKTLALYTSDKLISIPEVINTDAPSRWERMSMWACIPCTWLESTTYSKRIHRKIDIFEDD